MDVNKIWYGAEPWLEGYIPVGDLGCLKMWRALFALFVPVEMAECSAMELVEMMAQNGIHLDIFGVYGDGCMGVCGYARERGVADMVLYMEDATLLAQY